MFTHIACQRATALPFKCPDIDGESAASDPFCCLAPLSLNCVYSPGLIDYILLRCHLHCKNILINGKRADRPSGKGPDMVCPVSADRVDSLHVAGQSSVQRRLMRASSGRLCYPL